MYNSCGTQSCNVFEIYGEFFIIHNKLSSATFKIRIQVKLSAAFYHHYLKKFFFICFFCQKSEKVKKKHAAFSPL